MRLPLTRACTDRSGRVLFGGSQSCLCTRDEFCIPLRKMLESVHRPGTQKGPAVDQQSCQPIRASVCQTPRNLQMPDRLTDMQLRLPGCDCVQMAEERFGFGARQTGPIVELSLDQPGRAIGDRRFLMSNQADEFGQEGLLGPEGGTNLSENTGCLAVVARKRLFKPTHQLHVLLVAVPPSNGPPAGVRL